MIDCGWKPCGDAWRKSITVADFQSTGWAIRLGNIFSKLRCSMRALAIGAGLVTAAGWSSAEAQDFTSFIVIQPIQVCDDTGNNCAPVDFRHAATAQVYRQAGLMPIFLQPTHFNSTALLNANSGPASFVDANGGSADPNVVNAWFAGAGSITLCGVTPGPGIVGCANRPGKRLVIDGPFGANTATNNGLENNLFAHELGHNLGLPHITGATNLMDPFVRTGQFSAIGNTTFLLSAAEIATVQGDGKVQTAGNLNGTGGNDNLALFPGEAALNVIAGGGNDFIFISPGSGVMQDVRGNAGEDDIFVLFGSIVGNDVNGGADDDEIQIGGLVMNNVLGGTGNDDIDILSTAEVISGIFGGSGDDTISVDGKVAAGQYQPFSAFITATVSAPTAISGGGGNDTITLENDALVAGSVFGGANDDTIVMLQGASLAGNINGGDGGDIITILGSNVARFTDGAGGPISGGNILGGGGSDFITIAGGDIANNVAGQDGSDNILISGGRVRRHVLGGAGNDTIETREPGTVDGNVDGGSGDDTITIASDPLNIFGGIGSDLITLNAGTVVTNNVFGDDGDPANVVNHGDDTIVMNAGSVGNDILGEGGNDGIEIRGGTIGRDVRGNIGNDTIIVTGGSIGRTVSGDAGDDRVEIRGGTVSLNVLGGTGADQLLLTGGSVNGVIAGSGNDSILLDGTTVVTNITGGADNDIITILSGSALDVFGGDDNDRFFIRGGTVRNVFGGTGVDVAEWTGGVITTAVNMGDDSDRLDIHGVNFGGSALQAGLAFLDGGDDASSADGEVDVLNLRGVVEELTDLRNWEFINLVDQSRGDLGSASRTITTERFSIGSTSTLIAKAGNQVFEINGDLFNNGTIDMQNAAPVYDELAVTGVYQGGPFSLYGLDAFLGADGSPADLMRVGTATQGQTGLAVFDTNAAGPGVFNPIGIEVVRVESAVGGNTDADDFYLVGGPIQKDLWIWDLGLDDTRSQATRLNADVHVLYSRPTEEVQFTPYFATAALTAFHSSLDPWVHRQQALADTLASNNYITGSLKDEPVARVGTFVDLWVSPFGAHRSESSTSTMTFFGDTFSANMDYAQLTQGIQGGVDVITLQGDGSAVMGGVFGGLLSSSVSPDEVPVSGDFDGGSVGAYAAYVDGGLKLSAVVKADFLDFDWRANALGLNASTNADTYGGRIEAAYKHQLEYSAAWLEPYANLTYANSSWDDFTVLATTFAIGENESLLGRAGARFGTDVKYGENQFAKVFAGAGIVYEFDVENTASINSGGFELPLTHKVDATSLELQAGVKFEDLDEGLSLSITSSGRLSENSEEFGGKATLNYRF